MNSDIIKSFRVGLSNLLGRESYEIKGLYHHWLNGFIDCLCFADFEGGMEAG